MSTFQVWLTTTIIVEMSVPTRDELMELAETGHDDGTPQKIEKLALISPVGYFI